MKPKALRLLAGGQQVSVDEFADHTTVHIHLHLGASAVAASPEPTALTPAGPTPVSVPKRRAWLAPVGAGAAALVLGYGIATASQAPAVVAAPASVALPTIPGIDDRSQQAALDRLKATLRQQPAITPPAGGAQSAPSGQSAPNPFGLDN